MLSTKFKMSSFFEIKKLTFGISHGQYSGKKILLVPNLPGNYRHGKTAQSTTSPTYLPIYLTQIIKPPIFSSQLLTQGGYMCPMGKGPLKQAICSEGHKEDPAHVRSDRHLSSTAVKDACSQVSIMHTGRQTAKSEGTGNP